MDRLLLDSRSKQELYNTLHGLCDAKNPDSDGFNAIEFVFEEISRLESIVKNLMLGYELLSKKIDNLDNKKPLNFRKQ